MRYLAMQNITKEILANKEGFVNPILPPTVSYSITFCPWDSLEVQVLAYLPTTIFCTSKGKDELESAKKNMSVDPRPMNIIM